MPPPQRSNRSSGFLGFPVFAFMRMELFLAVLRVGEDGGAALTWSWQRALLRDCEPR